MNIRIKSQDLRFKISEEELTALLEGGAIREEVIFPGKVFTLMITPVTADRGDISPHMEIEKSNIHLNLLVSQKILQELADMGRSREGLRREVSGISVCIQVDLFSGKRKRKTA